MVGHGGSSAGSYLADPTSPIPSHSASIVVTSTVRVNLFTQLKSFNNFPISWQNNWRVWICFSELLFALFVIQLFFKIRVHKSKYIWFAQCTCTNVLLDVSLLFRVFMGFFLLFFVVLIGSVYISSPCVWYFEWVKAFYPLGGCIIVSIQLFSSDMGGEHDSHGNKLDT